MKIPWSWLLILFFVVNVIVIGQSQWATFNQSSVNITEQEAESLIEERYEGKVKIINLQNQLYHIEFERENKLYKVKLDSLSGGIISFDEFKKE